MVSSLSIRKALSAGLCVSLLATCSMFALANSGRVAGEVLVSGATETGVVMVNGESVKSGRSIFSPSSVVTTGTAGATVSLGKLGSVELAPNSSVVLSFDEKGVSGDLASGKLTVLRSAGKIAVKTSDGAINNLEAGQSVSAGGQAQTTTGGGGAAWWVWAAVFGGAATIIIYSAFHENRIAIGGDSTVVSPVR